MNSLSTKHIERNRQSAHSWQGAAEHRRHVTDMLLALAESTGRLQVLGAGNCNDLDLARLSGSFAAIALRDLDTDALADAVQRQLPRSASGGDGSIEICAATDLSGVIDLLDRLRLLPDQRDRLEQELSARWERLTAPQSHQPAGQYDVVASVCVLSQMVQDVLESFPDARSALPFIEKLRRHHLHMIASELVPGGRGVLITDFVSSDTVPQLPEMSKQDVGHAVAHWIESGNFFTGLNPAVLANQLSTDPALSDLVADVHLTAPWIWNQGARHYAVTAIHFRRRCVTA